MNALLILTALLFLSPSYLSADEFEYRQKLESEFSTNIQKEKSLLGKSVQVASPKALQSIEDSIASDTFSWFDNSFDIYISRYQGNVWVYVLPYGNPFVCSSGFTIFQNGVQYNYVKLIKESGESQCSTVSLPQLFMLSFWMFGQPVADLSKDFTLSFDGGLSVYSLTVPTYANVASVLVESFVTRFYQQCLGREPDQSGLESWVNGLLSGSVSGSDVANGFIFSPEFINRNTSNDDFATILYRAFFDRQPDSVGYSGWLNYLNTGASRQAAVNGFVQSLEFENLCSVYGIVP